MKKKTHKSSGKLKTGAKAVVAALTVLGAGFLLYSNKTKPIPVPSYEVKRVIDGDTFETMEGQHIRLASTEAPELTLCGGNEAKKALEKMILDKPIYLKVVFRDPYQRLVSLVYTKDTFVNEEMLARGNSYYYRSSEGKIGEDLKNATEKARAEGKGIFGKFCTQVTNKADSSCDIKGNDRNGKIYYLPDCGVYDNVIVQLYLGDRWFCTEKEAITAGFRKPETCP